MAETTGTVWLALTFNCCRCHDHKFDPLSQRDYYSLTAFFNQTPVDGGGGDPQTPPVLRVPDPAAARQLAEVSQQSDEARRSLDTERTAAASRRESWERERAAAGYGIPSIGQGTQERKAPLRLSPLPSMRQRTGPL
jgi:hypothetical protein